MKKWRIIAATMLLMGFSMRSSAQTGIGLNLDYFSFMGTKISNATMGLSYSAYLGDDADIYYGFNMGYFFPKTTTQTTTLIGQYTGTNPLDVNYELNTRMFLFGLTLGKVLNGDYEDGGFTVSLGYYVGLGNMRIPSHDSFDTNVYINPFPDGSGINQRQGITYMCGQLRLAYLLRVGETLALAPFGAFGFGKNMRSSRESTTDLYPPLKSMMRIGLSIEWMPY